MPFHDPLPGHIDQVISAANAVALIVHEIEAAPSRVAVMQREIEGLQAQIKFTEQSLESEQKSFDAERRRSLDARRHDYLVSEQVERDLSTQLSAAREKLREMQNALGAARAKVDDLARECRRLERLWQHPGAVPVGGGG
jgi:peptidoglycan hydrolase CwlO-like protein